MGKNVLIPLTLVKRTVELLEYWEISGYDRAIRDECRDVMRSFHAKLEKLELRDAYAKMIAAGDGDSRHDARIDYLWQRNLLHRTYGDDF